jgi:DNA-3-methyladenine glycosylase II
MPRFTIRPVPPFDFAHCAAIFSTGEPDIRIYRDGRFRQALAVEGVPVLVDIGSRGTIDVPELSVTIRSDRPVPGNVRTRASDIISRIFSVTDDLTRFYQAMQADPVMADLTRQLYGLRAPSTPTVFEALVDSVIEQQISLAAAHSMEYRLIRAVGRKLTLEDGTFYCYPTPENLAGTADATFRSCGLTVRKGEYIRGISEQILAGDLDPESFREDPDTESIITEMVKLRGVGRWTAELTILRGLHRPDAFPADDVGVRRFISQYYLGGEKITSQDARVFAGRWGDWKGFAAYYLEVADLLKIRPEI